MIAHIEYLLFAVRGCAPFGSVKMGRRAGMFFARPKHKPATAKNPPALRFVAWLRDWFSLFSGFWSVGIENTG